jgi:hypothetical protein
MARKVGQIIARGDRRSLIRVYLGRDRETNKRSGLVCAFHLRISTIESVTEMVMASTASK